MAEGMIEAGCEFVTSLASAGIAHAAFGDFANADRPDFGDFGKITLAADIRGRTGNAFVQAHTFTVTELALAAQIRATRPGELGGTG